MSLPWKKPKSSRILRFMSEFQQSPFVETGFPTSLIDLFFKNRDRLKKSPSKRFKRIERQIQTAPNASSLTNQDAVLEKPTGIKTVRSKIEKVNCVKGESAAEKKHAIKNSVCVCGGGGEVVLMAFKVLIVALLALSTKKKLTIGITLSAFALLLTELVAARVFTRSKLCNTGKDKNAIGREKIIETFDETRVPDVQETEHVVAETEVSKLKGLTIRDLLLKDEKSTSKSWRLKSKIVKKLRSYNNKKTKKTMMIKEESLIEVSSLVLEDKPNKVDSERDQETLNLPLMRSNGDKMNVIVLIVIVLTGLLCGKILAIVLTLSCLVLRFGEVQKI
ncbi:unnamed protein product [Arabidopsis lyrata]|uniref:Ethylene-responsive nuclear family protein n=1 Tax=Arabidopsis lyrata subsp. lyrata TaxID=81972 RepID=D7MMI2_ARALL|nr:uncharacterized protein LOC9299664 [Arabidopsis lyrata subsp. lyrata]EFH41627.1 hypothetical protein ARALYDRAFT_494551 [Arabidopsis lyrata subsp. lyrata]CAH8278389.1 unnamed protein product [Arabidopsis lyrata]|eukprot:XP_020871686.1 uncharacterized protein LOC9299664 [Arabidopsis lyrata subsp. lyrata]